MNCKEFRKVEGYLVGVEMSDAAYKLCEYAEQLEKQLADLKVAARHLATEADEYLEERINTGSADGMVLADAITCVEKLTLGEKRK